MSKNKLDYELLDSGQGRKLEQFGPYILSRPCGAAVWEERLKAGLWESADATFSRDERWTLHSTMPKEWEVVIEGMPLGLHLTEFGHLGIFPEQIPLWKKISLLCAKRPLRVLNLFAYSGGSTLAAAKAGAQVVHLDASKGMVEWAKKNALISRLDPSSVRWIVEDASKFLNREIRRESFYDGIILDPPSFGRGSKKEVFKIDNEIVSLLEKCRKCLSNQPSFILLSSHTPGYTPITLENLLKQACEGMPGRLESGEMMLAGAENVLRIPSGAFALWISL